MLRRLRIGIISPNKGPTFDSNAASYPPPSALSLPQLLLSLRKISSEREEAVRARDDAGIIHSSLLLIQASRHLDSLDLQSLKRTERIEAVRFKKARDRLMFSLKSLISESSQAGLASPSPQKASFQVPEHFSGFGGTLKRLNRELQELHSDPSLPLEMKLALDAMVESLNAYICSDASEISDLHRSKQYIASLRLSDHYEKAGEKILLHARKRDLTGMVGFADSVGINLPARLYKKGIYLKVGKGSPPSTQKSFK